MRSAKRRQSSRVVPEAKAEAALEARQQLSEVLQGSRVLLSGKDTKELAALVKTLGAIVLPMPGFQVTGLPLKPCKSAFRIFVSKCKP